jgi:hypothetical protein
MSNDDEATMEDFTVDQRVELHPATDRWMMGDRFGVVTKLDTLSGVVRVKLDKSKKSFNFAPRNILKKKV